MRLLPEGGHLVHGVMSKIGTVVIDASGRPVAAESITVTDDNGKLISTASLTGKGVGSLVMIPDVETRYKVTTQINGRNYETDFPEIDRFGVTLSLNPDFNNDNLGISIDKPQTLSQLQGQLLYVVIHRDGVLKS